MDLAFPRQQHRPSKCEAETTALFAGRQLCISSHGAVPVETGRTGFGCLCCCAGVHQEQLHSGQQFLKHKAGVSESFAGPNKYLLWEGLSYNTA